MSEKVCSGSHYSRHRVPHVPVVTCDSAPTTFPSLAAWAAAAAADCSRLASRAADAVGDAASAAADAGALVQAREEHAHLLASPPKTLEEGQY